MKSWTATSVSWIWLPTEVFFLVKSLNKVTLHTADTSFTLRARTQVSTPLNFYSSFHILLKQDFFSYISFVEKGKTNNYDFFSHLLTDISCPLIGKRVLTGDVYTAYISTVSERRGHAKACPIPQTTTFKAVM